MKITLMALFSSVLLGSVSAQAFISSQEQGQLLAAMNDGTFEHVHFEDIRCSQRSRLCIVKMEIGPKAIKAGCMIDRIQDASDIVREGRSEKGNAQLELSSYAAQTILNCVAELSK